VSTHARDFPDLYRPGLRSRPERRAAPLVQAFVVFLLLCQVALLSPDIGPVRMLVRAAAFGASLALLVLARGRGGRHPAAVPGILALVVVFLAVLNPYTTNLLAGVAQAALYTSVMAPLFWVPRLQVDTRVLRQAVLILWIFHTASATLGVLQVYFPGQFQPPVSSIIASKGRGYMESLMILTASGVKVFRPMGLTDIPGGASISGLYAVLFGTGFFLTRRTPWMMAASALTMVLGMTCLYLSQVRAVLVMTGIAVVVVATILAWRKDFARLGTLAGAALVVAVGGYTAAMSMAGPAVAKRVATLTASRPGTVYYNERGHFFFDAVTKTLPEAPFGSGLGHWGMMATYFGKGGDPARSVWVEIQWAGWIVDGGAPLALLYCAALLSAIWCAWKIARSRPTESAPDLPFWGVIVLAHGVGALALTFSYPIFLSQPGMEFWLLNAALFAAARQARRQVRAPVESRPAIRVPT
jgi:hypothetical protein